MLMDDYLVDRLDKTTITFFYPGIGFGFVRMDDIEGLEVVVRIYLADTGSHTVQLGISGQKIAIFGLERMPKIFVFD